MALSEQDFTIDQGSSFIMRFDLLKDDNSGLITIIPGATPNTYVANTYSFRIKLKKTKYNSTVALSINNLIVIDNETDGNNVDGFYLITSTLGRVKLVISSNTTSNIKHGKYFYDIEVVDTKPNGGLEVTKVLSGRMEILAEVTF